ncbi:MAG: RNA polymerase ECF-type sigma factor [Rhodanobacteraceae bacterium]|jgi:RNA polymerase sigma-70 factor (ECF subfamily)|nr:MAG: RNA polymerase ECF-type sigma factor [Rhodanobacteraceae bacterium]
MSDAARRAVERAARDSRARLVAFLAARSHDVAAAEDALSEAFRSALETWPRDGVPDKPEAWLLTAARRRLIDAARHDQVHAQATPELVAALDDAQVFTNDHEHEFPDERLKLLFVCAHPAIDAAARTPLMLQTVLGLDAARIASAFLVKPSAMGQRLARVKTKIRDAGIAFEIPRGDQLPERLDAVLEAIYAAYGSGWDDIAGADPRRKGLAQEALELGALLVRLLPDEPEALGLSALMLYCESRRGARRDPHDEYVPLSEQDVALWSMPMIGQADRLLRQAERMGRIGRFQLEAAIQSVHAQRARTGGTDWESIALLYEGLVRIAPSIGALVGRAAAVAQARDPQTGWTLLQQIPANAIANYQPYWALAAHLLECMHRTGEARAARERAVGLCEDAAMRTFLLRQQH